MIKIDTNIPVPTVGKYPWDQLEVGHSFFVQTANFNTLRSGCYSAGKRLSRRFKAGRVEGGVRVWRLA